MYHDNFEREELESFAKSFRNNAPISKVIVNDTNTIFMLICLSEMHDTAKCEYGDDIDTLAKRWNEEIGESIAYTSAYLRFNNLIEKCGDDNYTVFHRMLRYIVEKAKSCAVNHIEHEGFHDCYYDGYENAMLHIIDAFVYAYDIEFA